MESTLSPVTAKKDSLVNNVKLVLMTARLELIVILAFVQVAFKGSNVSVQYPLGFNIKSYHGCFCRDM